MKTITRQLIENSHARIESALSSLGHIRLPNESIRDFSNRVRKLIGDAKFIQIIENALTTES